MSIKLWTDTKKSSVIERLRNTITLRSFSAACSDFTTNSVRLVGDGTYQDYINHSVANNTDPTDMVTVEAWVKLTRWPILNKQAVIFYREITASPYVLKQIQLSVNSTGHVEYSLKQGGVSVVLTSAAKVAINDWVFITGSWDGITMRIFINGVADTNTHALSGTLDTVALDAFTGLPVNPNHVIGGYVANSFNGWIAEVRIWNSGRTRQNILNTYQGPRNYNYGSGIDDDLIYYYKLNEGSGIDITEWVNSENNTALAGTMLFRITSSVGGLTALTGPPLIYGASFVVAQFAFTLAQNCSLNYPVAAPDDVNFALIVRWTDDDGIIQRRSLWTVDGVDIAPNPAPYRGERLPYSFVLEAWNVDGAATVDLEDDLVIETSLITKPTSSIDLVEPNLFTVSSNKAIASLFPLTFPTAFSVAPTFTLPSSAAPPIPTNVGNVLGESGSTLGEGTTGLQ